jgi:hypothetical protein
MSRKTDRSCGEVMDCTYGDFYHEIGNIDSSNRIGGKQVVLSHFLVASAILGA